MKESTSIRLKKIMAERGLKQVDILERALPYCKKHNIKLTKADLSQYVSGKVEPGQLKLSMLGMALDVSEAWLMGYNVPMERCNDYVVKNGDLKFHIEYEYFSNQNTLSRYIYYIKKMETLSESQRDIIYKMIDQMAPSEEAATQEKLADSFPPEEKMFSSDTDTNRKCGS